MDDTKIHIFKGSRDMFNGIIVRSTEEQRDSDSFEPSLAVSIQEWQKDKIRGIWFNIDISNSHWVPILAKYGFQFHRAEAKEVVMVRWLPTDEPSCIPRYAHTVVGVGAVVVRDDTDELLAVCERYQSKPHWKLPGGYVEKGEDLSVAASREVLEETGVLADFHSVLAVRHMHGAAFNCSDLYFVVLMQPKTTDVTVCSLELSRCQWMKVEEYRNHPLVNEVNRLFIDCYLQWRKHRISITATPLNDPRRKQIVYAATFGGTLKFGDEILESGSDALSLLDGNKDGS